MDYKYYVHVNCGAGALHRALSNPGICITPFSSFPALCIEVFKGNYNTRGKTQHIPGTRPNTQSDNNTQGCIPTYERWIPLLGIAI